MAAITDDEALANGWVITYDAFGRKVYQADNGFVYDVETGQQISNVNRMPIAGDSAGMDYWTQAADLVKQGLSVFQLNQQQRAFNDVNKALALQGKAPLSWSQFQPTASVGVALDPKILWTIGIVGVLVALGLFGGGRGRRR